MFFFSLLPSHCMKITFSEVLFFFFPPSRAFYCKLCEVHIARLIKILTIFAVTQLVVVLQAYRRIHHKSLIVLLNNAKYNWDTQLCTNTVRLLSWKIFHFFPEQILISLLVMIPTYLGSENCLEGLACPSPTL